MGWLSISLLILIPAFPVVAALACLPWRKRWQLIDIIRWGLLALCSCGLLLWAYDASCGRHLRKSLGLHENVFGFLLMQLALAYVVALLVSFLSPWRRPLNGR